MYPRLERFLLGPKFACIEAEIQAERVMYHLSVVRRKGEKAQSEILLKRKSAISDLVKTLDHRIPVALIVTGKGVINRKFTGNIGLSDEALIRSILPNANAADLLVSRFQDSDSSLIASIIRKETVGNITELLHEVSIVSVVIGPCVALTILDLLGAVQDELVCSNHILKFDSGFVSEVVYVERDESVEISVGKELIAEENLVSFAGALQGLSHTSSIPGEAAGFAERRRNFFRMKRYGAFVKLSTLTALLVLLINVFLFTHFRELKSEFESDPTINSETFLRYHELKTKITSNREFIDASGIANNTSYAWMADQIAKDMPHEIVLTRLSMSPNENFGRTDTLGFQPDRIFITGTCNESSSLNTWLKLLQKLSWISSAQITSYSDAGSSSGKFEIELSTE